MTTYTQAEVDALLYPEPTPPFLPSEAPTGAPIFWIAWVMVFGVGAASVLGGIYLARVTNALGWIAVRDAGLVILSLCLAAVWKMGHRGL
jgi:hypothetical protein